MKFETALSLILDINEKYERSDRDKFSENYYEMLHATLFEIISGYTEETFNSIPASYRVTIEKLENEILDCCSKTYVDNYYEYIKENGKFMKNNGLFEYEINHNDINFDEYVDDDDDEDHYEEEDEIYEPKWIDNPPYNSNLIL